MAADPHIDKDAIGGLLTGLTTKLALAGVALTEVVTLAEPIKKIAGWVGLSLKFLGLS